MKFLKVVMMCFLFLWQLPQNLLGLLVILFTRAKYSDKDGVWLTEKRIGVSLGFFIILYKKTNAIDIKHEEGHQKQSIYLGPLYLFVVGIPSAFRNLHDRFAHFGWRAKERIEWYYSGYPEKWADRLGGVMRY